MFVPSPATTHAPAIVRRWEGSRGEAWFLAQAALLLLYWLVGLRPSGRGARVGAWQRAVGGLATGTGLGVMAAALAAHDWRMSPLPRPGAGRRLIVSGIYTWLRHPMYTGLVLALVGYATAGGQIQRLGVAAVLALVLDGKARREETWLAQDDAYAGYQQRVRRFIPGVY